MRDLNSAREPAPPRPAPAPLLSIVIPTFDVDRFIDTCLDALTQQTFQNFEIIVVDGGSDDQTRVLLEKRMIDEPRLAVLWQGRVGPGPARNAGAGHAIGDYLWFVDADDQAAPGALNAIADRLRTQRPDVLLVNHEVQDGGGNLEAGQDDKLITQAGAGPFTLAERPWMLDLGMVSWNKIVRREFFHSSRAQFASSWPHEDVPVSCELMLSARQISVLNQVCYYYWKNRPDSATSAGNRFRHFGVFDAWRPILNRTRTAQMTASGSSAVATDLYRVLFQRAIWHCSTILDAEGYVGRADRREFFGRISALYADFAPTAYRPPPGLRGVKFTLIARGFYAGYAALDPLNKARVAVQRRLSRR